jgi:hypothetical protein
VVFGIPVGPGAEVGGGVAEPAWMKLPSSSPGRSHAAPALEVFALGGLEPPREKREEPLIRVEEGEPVSV